MARLTEEMVIARSRQSDLSTVKKLNCWGSELSDVSIIKRMRGVEVLALSVNKITSLSDFENCHSLQELYLRKNNIKDIAELAYLQGLPHLRYLWLEENPCVENAGPNYRSIVLRALPSLKKLDNVDVTPEEVADAQRASVKREEVYEDPYVEPVQQSPSQPATQPQQQQQQQQQQQWRQQSPVRDSSHHSSENTESEGISETIDRDRPSVTSSPLQRSPPAQESYSPAEQTHPPSPKYQRDHRNPYQQYDRSPSSEQESVVGYRDRPPIVPSMSTHSMKEYYQSDYQKSQPAHYRHSQSDLTEWDEQQQHQQQTQNNNHTNSHRDNQHHSVGSQGGQGGGSGGGGRRVGSAGGAGSDRDQYQYRNGNGNGTSTKDRDDYWDDAERRRDSRRNDRFNDSASAMTSAVLHHYASYHRRPVNRSSNLLSATLCLVKELDYPSLEVVEHAVRCRIDELAGE